MSSRNLKVANWAEVYTKFEKRCAGKKIKPSSMAHYRRTMGRFCAWADGEGIKPAQFEPLDAVDYLGGISRQDGEPYKAHSLRTHARDVKTLLNFASDYKIIPERIKVEMPKTPDDSIKALTDQELGTVLDWFNERGGENPRDAAIVHLLKDSGLRASELLALNYNDLSWDKERQLGTINVTKQMNRNREFVSTKNGKPRTAFFYADTYYWLSQTRIAAGWNLSKAGQMINLEKGELPGTPSPEAYQWQLDHPLFWLSYGEVERMGASGLGYMLKKAGEKIGIPLHPHLFRHTAGRLMTKAGLSPIAIMQVLGHSDLIMVMRYSKLWGPDLAEVMAEAMNGNH